MQLAPPTLRPFERPFRRSRRAAAKVAYVGGATVISGSAFSACVLDLQDLPPVGVGGFGGIIVPIAGAAGLGGNGEGSGGQSVGGAGSGGVGAAGTGASDAGAVNSPCPSGQKLCGGTCRPHSVEIGCAATDCNPCPTLDNGTVGCSAEGQCTLVSCSDGFADCNGDALGQSDISASNGCEYSFGTLADPSPPMRAPERTMFVDGKMDDWAGIPAYPLREVCSESGCEDPEFAPINAFARLPLKRDLDAYFRIAWDASFLYLVAEAFDDDIYIDQGVLADPKCDKAADCEESMTLFFDGFDTRAQDPGYGGSGRRLFMGLGNSFNSKFDSADNGRVGIKGQRNGASCYRIEAQVSWDYLVPGGNAPAGQSPPAVGNTYGFDLSLSDWDNDLLSSPQQVRRQSQVFWVNPGPEYRGTMAGFQELQLAEPPSE